MADKGKKSKIQAYLDKRVAFLASRLNRSKSPADTRKLAGNLLDPSQKDSRLGKLAREFVFTVREGGRVPQGDHAGLTDAFLDAARQQKLPRKTDTQSFAGALSNVSRSVQRGNKIDAEAEVGKGPQKTFYVKDDEGRRRPHPPLEKPKGLVVGVSASDSKKVRDLSKDKKAKRVLREMAAKKEGK
tara:strand:+ start:4127 stop:4684 length:558 start_codon:yes stop_codon:yes gene_type:complete